jgi:hypothetical protein
MNEIWIVGYGHFGQRALQVVQADRPDAVFRIIDTHLPQDELLGRENAATVTGDGVTVLASLLARGDRPGWIIPALPVHLAAEWCLASASFSAGAAWVKRPVPEEVCRTVPNPVRSEGGECYASYAAFRCPEDCPEPAEHCYVTGKPRTPLYDQLREISIAGYRMAVIRSFQLAPGVGGYTPGQLFELQRSLGEGSGHCLICTASRCHGVITAVRRQ